MSFCVYLTAYSGNVLPPFYVGSASLKKVQAGYRGSVGSRKWRALWKQELLNRPELFSTVVLSEHSTRQEAFDAEEEVQRRLDVVDSELFVNMALANGGFSTKGPLPPEHKANVVAALKGRKHSEKTKQLLSEMKIGKKIKVTAKWYGPKHSDETKAKMAASRKGVKKTPEHRAAIAASLAGNQNNKGKTRK